MQQKKKGSIRKLFCVFCCLISFKPAFSATFESFDNLKQVAEAFIKSNLSNGPSERYEVIINQRNAPQNLPLCAEGITASLPPNTTMSQVTSVQLTCSGQNPWQVLLPLEVQQFEQVLVSKRNILPKEVIAESDIDTAFIEKKHLVNGFFHAYAEIEGDTSNQYLPAGTVLTKKNLKLPILVHKNQTITLSAVHNKIVVSMHGIAKADGCLNAVIKVFNPSSKRTVDAMVTGPNQAQVIG